MSLHERESARNIREADIYGTRAADVPVPKFKLGQSELRSDVAKALVRDELFLDGNARQNLSTFCQTWLDAEIHQLMDLSIDKNMIDKDEYPATAEIESRCVNILADLWHSPEAANTIGCSTTGSSEACMLGGLALKWKWRQRMRAAGKPTDKPKSDHRPGPGLLAQVRTLFRRRAARNPAGARPPRHDGRGSASNACDENTIGVMPTFGVTFTCHYEPVAEVAAALDKLARDMGPRYPHACRCGVGRLHRAVHRAGPRSGTSASPRVKSINASGHKYGLAPLGVGWVVWRDKAELPEELIFNVNYLGGNMPTFALNFSRPAGQIISQYYLFLRLGRDGYTADPAERLRYGAAHRRRSLANWVRSSCSSTETAKRAFRRFRGSLRTGRIPDILYLICLIACAFAAGRWPPTQCRRTSKKRWSCVFSYATDSAATWGTCCSKIRNGELTTC